MPDTRGRPLPSEILAALKDPSIVSWLRTQALANASSESIGRFPGIGAAQNDNFPYNDNVDNNSPAYIDYVLPKNFQRIVSARLSIRHRAYRTYNSFTAVSTGAETGHSHSHAHTIPITGAVFANAVGWDGAGQNLKGTGGGNTGNINTNAQGSSGHTHPLTLTGALGVTEAAAPVNPGTTIAFDGVDQTAALGGPWNSDQVEIDITKFISTAVSIWHTVSLQPNQLVRMVALLRISYYVDSRLAQ
jgi:hypothetical protein